MQFRIFTRFSSVSFISKRDELGTVSLPTVNSGTKSSDARGSKILWIVILAFALRAAIRFGSGEADFWNNGYGFFFTIAQNIASGDEPTAFRVPLYPIFLAAITFGHREFMSIILIQSLIGAGTVWCAWQIARLLFGNTAGLIAGVLTAIYPYYLIHDTALQETSLYTFLTALAVLLLIEVGRSRSGLMALCAGATLGAAVLTRATLAPFALLAPLSILVRPDSNANVGRSRSVLCLLCATALTFVVSPWLVRSYWLTGSPTLSTEAGIALWDGNNPFTFSHYPIGSIDRSHALALSRLSPQQRADINALGPNEVAIDHWFLKEGLSYMREHPWQTIANGLRKISAGFCVLPSPRRSFWPNLVYFSTYGPLMILGILGMWRSRQNWREHLIFYVLFITFVGLTAIYFAHTSHRSYLDVYFIVFASIVLKDLRNILSSSWRINRIQSLLRFSEGN
jgi:4-amino-4-deoxy-L-arabinose transferase-like glycosyltransferase